jgi:carbamoyltransferase
MKIIGYQSGHDVAYAILENGVPIIHEELERFTRIKEPLGDGLQMIFDRVPKDYLDDVKYFTFGNLGALEGKYKDECISFETNNQLQETLKNNPAQYYEVGHHQSHAANAFFSSNYDEALVVTLDGGGTELDGTRTSFTIWHGKDNKINPILISDDFYFNLGAPWRYYVGRIFGLSDGPPAGNAAGTVMAMASVGEPKYVDDFYPGFINYPLDKIYEKYKPIADRSEQDKFDIAASIQKATEKITREKLEPYVKQYNLKNLCLSGGVSLNSVMVGKMYDWFDGIVENIFVDPIPYDGGLALGSARYLWHHELGNPRIKWEDNSSSYLGVTYEKNEIEEAIEKNKDKIVVEKCNDDKVVDLLIEQNIISVFGGGSESGRRALGNRSILCDPRSPDMKAIINDKVKHRQWFRPFAPSILREDVGEWFKRDVDSPYMSLVLEFKDEVKEKVPAVVHLDGTGRLQTVTENDNKWYYNFIKKFKEKTGVPIVLNTSFNDREPIVEIPEHAINCYLGTDIDYLYFRDAGLLIKKIED